MAVDTTIPRSRRALLAAALGAGAAVVAQALGRPSPVSATDGDAVTVGGSFSGTAPTTITNSAGDGIVARNTSTAASGLFAHASATSGMTYGVFGRSDSNTGTGVFGTGPAAGVYGLAVSGIGVAGRSTSGVGVSGGSTSSSGVQGASNLYIGVYGVSGASDQPGSAGRSIANSTGLLGSSGGASDSLPAAALKTGVYGYSAVDSGSVGVRGQSASGTGVLAVASTGTALRVSGKARFKRSGRASVPKRRNYVDVTVSGGIASNTVVNATVQMYRSGVAVAGVRLNYPSAGRARIYLTRVASTASSTPVAWLATEYGS